MPSSDSSKVLELFGRSTRCNHRWPGIVRKQWCPFTNTKCFKVRKSQPETSIGTCTVRYGREAKDVIICPKRLLERKQVFADCLHLLTRHEPGNVLHIVPEVSIPGGSVDYFLASVRKSKIRDFVAIEFQTLDTTGTLWPERQRLLKELRIEVPAKDVQSNKAFGMNWKMTAKTILVQLNHKIETLEHVGKRFVLVVQDHLLDYLQREFNFNHLDGVRSGDTMHVHAYQLSEVQGEFQLDLRSRLSTDAAGVAQCLGIQADTKMELQSILAELERKISPRTLFTLDDRPIPVAVDMPVE